MNQRVIPPYGDIFLAGTPALDKLSQQVYNEHLANEQNHIKQMQGLDDDFARNLSGVRQGDIPDVVAKWQDYKKAKIGTYKNNLPDLERINQEQGAMQKLGDVYRAINNSKQTQADLMANAKAYAAKRNLFRRDTPTLLSAANNLPSDAVKNYKIIGADGKPATIDLTNSEHLLYPVGSSDLTKIYDYALTGQSGKKVDKLGYKTDENGAELNVSKDPLQTVKVSLSGLSNTAPVIAGRLVEGLGKLGSNSDDFLSENPHLSDQQYQADIDSRYNALINSPNYKMAHKGQQLEFPSYMYNTEIGRAAITKSKELTLNQGDISETPEKPTPNPSAKLVATQGFQEAQQNRQFKHAELMRNLSLADSKKLIDYRQAAKDAGEENTWVQNYVDKTIEENKPKSVLGIPWKEKAFVPDPTLYAALGKPDKAAVTKDGKIKVTYLMSDNKTVDDSRTTTLTPEQVKLALGYKATTKKALTQEMNTTPQKVSTPASTKVYHGKMADGSRITSTDGVNWIDSKGKKISNE